MKDRVTRGAIPAEQPNLAQGISAIGTQPQDALTYIKPMSKSMKRRLEEQPNEAGSEGLEAIAEEAADKILRDASTKSKEVFLQQVVSIILTALRRAVAAKGAEEQDKGSKLEALIDGWKGCSEFDPELDDEVVTAAREEHATLHKIVGEMVEVLKEIYEWSAYKDTDWAKKAASVLARAKEIVNNQQKKET